MSKTLDAEMDRAQREGWFIASDPVEIQRDDERNYFQTDEDARHFVAAKAKEGSAYHQAALDAVHRGFVYVCSRDGKQVGTVVGQRECRLEGCRGLCYAVRWPKKRGEKRARVTWPCSKGLKATDHTDTLIII